MERKQSKAIWGSADSLNIELLNTDSSNTNSSNVAQQRTHLCGIRLDKKIAIFFVLGLCVLAGFIAGIAVAVAHVKDHGHSTSTASVLAITTASTTASIAPTTTANTTSSTTASTTSSNPTPTNPISIKSSLLLGNQTSNVTGTYRDMGYAGTIGATHFRVFGDTSIGNATNAALTQVFAAPNSFALSDNMLDPTKVEDFGTHSPPMICNSSVEALRMRLHMTSLVPLNLTTGMVFYSNISMNQSKDFDGAQAGSGVATITYDGSGPPGCKVIPMFWNATDPQWGDHDAIIIYDGNIYLYGSMGVDSGANQTGVYCARVKQSEYTNKSSYEYWNGTQFGPTFNATPEAVVLDIEAQGSIHYNMYYRQYMYIYPVAIARQIMATTATQPMGPWSDPIIIYNATEMIYGPVAQPYYDPTGKTLVVDMSIFSHIYTVTARIEFN